MPCQQQWLYLWQKQFNCIIQTIQSILFQYNVYNNLTILFKKSKYKKNMKKNPSKTAIIIIYSLSTYYMTKNSKIISGVTFLKMSINIFSELKRCLVSFKDGHSTKICFVLKRLLHKSQTVFSSPFNKYE